MTFRCSPLLLAAIALTPAVARPQAPSASPAQVSATDYARAEALIGWNARELVIDEAVNPKWMSAHWAVVGWCQLDSQANVPW